MAPVASSAQIRLSLVKKLPPFVKMFASNLTDLSAPWQIPLNISCLSARAPFVVPQGWGSDGLISCHGFEVLICIKSINRTSEMFDCFRSIELNSCDVLLFFLDFGPLFFTLVSIGVIMTTLSGRIQLICCIF